MLSNLKQKLKNAVHYLLQYVTENFTKIFWLMLFLVCAIVFLCVPIPKDYRDTLELILQITASRAFVACNLLSKDHIPAIKALLFNICFPFIIFTSLAKANRSQIPEYALVSGVAILQDFLALFAVGGMMWLFVRFKAMKKSEALGVVFSMSAIATMSTGYPFALMISDTSALKIVFMDQGNKIWILVVVYIIVVMYFGKNVGGYRELAKTIATKIIQNPLIIGFVLGFICLGAEYNLKKQRLTGSMALTFSKLTGTITMIFIGMKLEIPQDPKPFLPICLRRAFGLLFVAAVVPAFGLSNLDFKTLVIYVSAGSSLFPYVYFKDIAPNDPRLDTEYLFQTVTYDYFAAIVVNSVISIVTIPTPLWAAIVGCGFLLVACILGIFSRWIHMKKQINKNENELEIATAKL